MPAEPPAGDRDVPAVAAALGLPGLVDLHVHAMPDRLQRRVWEYFDTAGPLVGRHWPVRYRQRLDQRTAILRRLGVRAWAPLAYPHRPGMAPSLNAWSAEHAARVPEAVATATFFPEPAAPAYLGHALDAGAAVVKVHVQVGGFDPRDPLLTPVWGLLAERGVPVVCHCASGPVPGAFTGPEPVAAVLAAHPRLRLVVAHLGMPEYGPFLDLVSRHPRAALDTTMAFTAFSEHAAPFPRDRLPQLRDLGLAGKVALGSDFPSIPYPYAEQVAALVRLDLGDAWLRAVLHDTAAGWLGLPATPAASR